MTHDFQNKKILITGGSSGIGKATAEKFVEQGAHVIIASNNKTEGEEACNEIGAQCSFIETDVRNEKHVQALFQKIKEKYASLDHVVSSAGVYPSGQWDIPNLELGDFEKTMNTNFTGVFLIAKYALPFLQRSQGSLVNIASALGLAPEKESPIYCSSKAAVIMFTKVLALQYADKNVRINAVCPGPIDTPMLQKAFKTTAELGKYLEENPMKRAGKPENVANLIMFLASPKASYITGGVYTVDGGESL